MDCAVDHQSGGASGLYPARTIAIMRSSAAAWPGGLCAPPRSRQRTPKHAHCAMVMYYADMDREEVRCEVKLARFALLPGLL